MQNKPTPSKADQDAKSPPPLPPEEGSTDIDSALHGEGSYSGTRDYNARTREYLDHADVEADARRAAPTDPEDEKLLEEAEEAGKKPLRGTRDN